MTIEVRVGKISGPIELANCRAVSCRSLLSQTATVSTQSTCNLNVTKPQPANASLQGVFGWYCVIETDPHTFLLSPILVLYTYRQGNLKAKCTWSNHRSDPERSKCVVARGPVGVNPRSIGRNDCPLSSDARRAASSKSGSWRWISRPALPGKKWFRANA